MRLVNKLAAAVLAGGVILGCMANNAAACTVFAAIGDGIVENGGTLVNKNRDQLPSYQELRLVVPQNGYRYYGIFSGKTDKRYGFSVAGINEYGLFMGMTTAGSIPKAERYKNGLFHSSEGLRSNEYMLRYCKSVEEALAMPKEVWRSPVNYIMADREQIAYIEVLPDGNISVTKKKHGVLYHTNHYVNEDSKQYNIKIGMSSRVRYARIKQLMEDKNLQPFNMEKFIEISEDRHDGESNSLYRDGLKAGGIQTIANFAVYLPKQGEPELYIKYRQRPDDKGNEKVVRLTLKQAVQK